MKVLFGLPKDYSSLLLISQNKILEYTWVPSSRSHKQALATAPTTPFRHHYRNIDTNLAIFMILARDLVEDKDYLCYEHRSIADSALLTSFQFHYTPRCETKDPRNIS